MGSKADDVSHGGATAAVLLDDPATEEKRDGPCVVNESKDEAARSAEAADGLQAQEQPDKADIPIDPRMEDSKSSEKEDAAAEAEEKQVLTTETNQSEQAKEENIVQEEEEEEVSSIVNSKDPSATANAGSANLVLPPSELSSVLHVTLPPKDAKEEEDKVDATHQAEQLSAAQKEVVKSEITSTMVAVQPTIGVKGATAKCTTPFRPLAAPQSSGDDNDGEEKKMDDEDFAIARPRSPPTTPGTNTSGILTSAKVVPPPLGVSSMSTPQSDTTKAKSMPTPSSTACSSGGSDGSDGRSLEELMTTDDMANATTEQKVDGLKLLLSIIKNLSDPELSTGPSHHMISWDCQGDSVSGILRSCPFVREYFTERIGFPPLTKSGETFLCLFDTDDEGSYVGVEEDLLQRALLEVNYVLAKLNGREQEEEETMPEEKKENKLSDQNEPRLSVDVSANQEVANTMLTLARGSNAIIGDINDGNVANKLVRAEGVEHNVSEDDVAKIAGVPDPTVTDNSSPPVSMHEAKAKLCASPDDETEIWAETKVGTESSQVIVIGGECGGFHTITYVDQVVECNLTCDPRKKRFDYAEFDVVRVGATTWPNAFVAVGPYYLTVPTDDYIKNGIKQECVDFRAFCRDNARFIGTDGASNSNSEEYGLGIRIETKDPSGTSDKKIECIFNGNDPNRLASDGRTVDETLRQFAKSFVKFHQKWRKNNPERAEEAEKADNDRSQQQQMKKDAQSQGAVEDAEANSRCNSPPAQPNESIGRASFSYQPSTRERHLNQFVTIVSEEAPGTDLTEMIFAWNEEQISNDDMICKLAGVLSERAIGCFNQLLPREYSIKCRYGTSSTGEPLLVYRGPKGLQTTDRRAQELFRNLNRAQSSADELFTVDGFMHPIPDSYSEMKALDLSTIIRGCIACEAFDDATHVLGLVETVIDENDAFDGTEGVLGPVYDLRGQVLLEQTKFLLTRSDMDPFEKYNCGYDPALFDDDSDGQVQELLEEAQNHFVCAQNSIIGISSEPGIEILQDLCTLNMRVGKTYELQGRTSEATYAFEEALRLLHQVRPHGSSRIAAAHFDLGDLYASTLVLGRNGYWAGDNQSMPKTVAHYLSSASSVAIALASRGGGGAEELFVSPGENILSDTMEQIEKQNEWEPINLGRWALHELSQIIETVGSIVSGELHRGDPGYCAARMHWGRIRKRLDMLAKHPMYRDGMLGEVKVKREREEDHYYGPVPFTINEGDSHKENSLPSSEYENHYMICNTRASKRSKMEK